MLASVWFSFCGVDKGEGIDDCSARLSSVEEGENLTEEIFAEEFACIDENDSSDGYDETEGAVMCVYDALFFSCSFFERFAELELSEEEKEKEDDEDDAFLYREVIG